MKYTKTPLTFSEQAELLLDRGLKADRQTLIDRLQHVNYYRLSAYWHVFRQKGSELLKPEATLDTIWDRYVFDRQLRVIVKHLPAFHHPVPVPPNTTFAVLTVLRYLMTIIAPQSRWPDRLESLWLSKHPGIPLDQMGFPEHWRECPIWHPAIIPGDSGPEAQCKVTGICLH